MSIFFKFPQKSKLGQIIPKSKIFEHAKLNSTQKKIFSETVKQIRWAYKLSPETVNLSATGAGVTAQMQSTIKLEID